MSNKTLKFTHIFINKYPCSDLDILYCQSFFLYCEFYSGYSPVQGFKLQLISLHKQIKANEIYNHDQQGESKRFGFGMMVKKKTHDFDDCTTSIKSTEKLLNNIKKKQICIIITILHQFIRMDLVREMMLHFGIVTKLNTVRSLFDDSE